MRRKQAGQRVGRQLPAMHFDHTARRARRGEPHAAADGYACQLNSLLPAAGMMGPQRELCSDNVKSAVGSLRNSWKLALMMSC